MPITKTGSALSRAFLITHLDGGDTPSMNIGRLMHIGKRIKEVFDNQPKGHTIRWFASGLHCDRRNIYNIFNRPNIDVELLMRISVLLNYDFFAELSESIFEDNAGKNEH